MPREWEGRGHGATRIGIKDIARELGVSIGTVDRGLNGKPGISPATRARVLALAEEVGYTPNLAGRYLQSRRPFRVAVHLPAHIALFWDALREGIREAAAPFAPALQLEFRSYPRLGDGDVALLERALEDGPDGVIVAPGDPAALAPLLEEAAHRGIPPARGSCRCPRIRSPSGQSRASCSLASCLAAAKSASSRAGGRRKTMPTGCGDS